MVYDEDRLKDLDSKRGDLHFEVGILNFYSRYELSIQTELCVIKTEHLLSEQEIGIVKNSFIPHISTVFTMKAKMSEDAPFKKVGTVILLVSDMEKSVKFYREVLHLPIKSQSEEWTEFFNVGTVIALHLAKRKAKIGTGIGVLIGFMDNDLEATVNRLKMQGVKFCKEPKEETFGKHTTIEDPDGHLISIA